MLHINSHKITIAECIYALFNVVILCFNWSSSQISFSLVNLKINYKIEIQPIKYYHGIYCIFLSSLKVLSNMIKFHYYEFKILIIDLKKISGIVKLKILITSIYFYFLHISVKIFNKNNSFSLNLQYKYNFRRILVVISRWNCSYFLFINTVYFTALLDSFETWL